MLTVENLANPNIVDRQSDYSVDKSLPIKDIDVERLNSISSEYINVLTKGKVIGAIKRERLCYLIEKLHQVQFVQILDSLDVGVVAIDKDSRIFYINPAYARILGVEVAKVLGRYMSIIEPKAALLKVLGQGKPHFIENQLIESVNTYVQTSMWPLIDGKQVIGAFSVFTDTTQINMLHQEVRRISQVAEEFSRQIEENEGLKSSGAIGESKIYKEAISKAIKVAKTDAMVLLRGENGAGKEVFAKIIREQSERKEKAFITVNCSAVPESLIESELFGYEEGSFTGASKGGKLGKFQLADKGTLFLDEIGDMPYNMQAKLLRVLQEGEIEKIGRDSNIPIDVRVIAATNKNLEKMVEEGTFREDLYYRLNVISIRVPALRERGHDVVLLANDFLSKYNDKYHRNLQISKEAYEKLMNYAWPGNIRELKNTIESTVVLCEGDVIKVEDLPEQIRALNDENILRTRIEENLELLENESLKDAVARFEKDIILKTLDEFKGDRGKTMEALGLSKRTFYRKIANYGTEKQ